MAIQRQVVHVEFFETIGGKRHYYFGSRAAVFNRFTDKQMGTTYNSLKATARPADVPIVTKTCIIRIGRLITKGGLKEK